MKRILLILSIAAGITLIGCGSEESSHTHGEGGDHTHETEQHAHEEGMENEHEHEGESHNHAEDAQEHTHSGEEAHAHEGETSGMMLGHEDTHTDVRRGVRLKLSYNSESEKFSGTIENTTQESLPQVGVQVELSNGTVLGPTTPVDLGAGESQPVELDASGESFESWSAQSELRSGGHTHGEDGDHEHHH